DAAAPSPTRGDHRKGPGPRALAQGRRHDHGDRRLSRAHRCVELCGGRHDRADRNRVAAVTSAQSVPIATPTFTMVLVTLFGTLVYLGLAIAGMGGFSAFFSHPALIALTIIMLLMSGAALLTSGNLSAGEREDRSNRWVIAAISVVALVA